MIGLNRDTSVALTAFVVIALFVSVNMYIEAHDTGGEYVRWGEFYSEPLENAETGLLNFTVDTVRGQEIVSFNPDDQTMTGNFITDNRTLLFDGASITVIDINRTHMKGLMVPSDVPLHTRGIFYVFVNLEDDFECSVRVNGAPAEWGSLGMVGNTLAIELDFDAAGTNDVAVTVSAGARNYSLGWTVHVR